MNPLMNESSNTTTNRADSDKNSKVSLETEGPLDPEGLHDTTPNEHIQAGELQNEVEVKNTSETHVAETHTEMGTSDQTNGVGHY